MTLFIECNPTLWKYDKTEYTVTNDPTNTPVYIVEYGTKVNGTLKSSLRCLMPENVLDKCLSGEYIVNLHKSRYEARCLVIESAKNGNIIGEYD